MAGEVFYSDGAQGVVNPSFENHDSLNAAFDSSRLGLVP
jgi:hypothetical protein